MKLIEWFTRLFQLGTSNKAESKSVLVCISVGHSSKDNGAEGFGKTEFIYNSRLAPLVAQSLKKQGFRVVLTKREDAGGTTAVAAARAIIATGADIACELHLNAYNGSASGTECLYYAGSPVGESLAEHVSSKISAAIGTKNRGAKSLKNGDNGVAIVRDPAPMPCIIIESAFIDNAGDNRRLDDIASLADAIAAGLALS